MRRIASNCAFFGCRAEMLIGLLREARLFTRHWSNRGFRTSGTLMPAAIPGRYGKTTCTFFLRGCFTTTQPKVNLCAKGTQIGGRLKLALSARRPLEGPAAVLI